ncbi:MAG: multiheme c-type cytochrome [Dehalococcoidales bacterium]|jgi:hypothetical protein|nr:multiheme c-type cytochrome [Dehalococcoidales bacterium]MDD5604358.1 multiheme c-type cytochrome [Dehalococcoidales bacterium]MDX9986664.1 multiheme c-type cytochrome [Dehalococcoidales bacterium]
MNIKKVFTLSACLIILSASLALLSSNQVKAADESACVTCHTRHSFSINEARQPEACLPCHQGFDHPQYEMWSTSKHGIIYGIEHLFS